MFKSRKRKIETDKKSPIIVGACHRSGTSLMRRILDTHSNISCPPEIKFFKDFYADYFNDDLKHLRFFSTLKKTGLSEKDLLKIHGQAFVKSHEALCLKNNKIRWADKNPENVLHLKEWTEILNGNFFFVLLVRNPHDTIASLLEAKFEKTLPQSFEDLVNMYLNYTNTGLNFAKQNPEKSIVIRYVDLVSEPEKTVTKLMDFVGENLESKMLTNFNNSKIKDGIEDPKVKKTKKIHSKSVGRGQTDLDKTQIDYINKKCKKIINQIFYA